MGTRPKSNSMWEKMKGFGNQMSIATQQAASQVATATKKAADSTQRAAKRAKIQTEILLLENKLKDEKRKFGLKVYDSLVRGHESEWRPILAAAKVKIDAIALEIETKKMESMQLSDGKGEGLKGTEAAVTGNEEKPNKNSFTI